MTSSLVRALKLPGVTVVPVVNTSSRLEHVVWSRLGRTPAADAFIARIAQALPGDDAARSTEAQRHRGTEAQRHRGTRWSAGLTDGWSSPARSPLALSQLGCSMLLFGPLSGRHPPGPRPSRRVRGATPMIQRTPSAECGGRSVVQVSAPPDPPRTARHPPAISSERPAQRIGRADPLPPLLSEVHGAETRQRHSRPPSGGRTTPRRGDHGPHRRLNGCRSETASTKSMSSLAGSAVATSAD